MSWTRSLFSSFVVCNLEQSQPLIENQAMVRHQVVVLKIMGKNVFLQNLHLTFDWHYIEQMYVGDFPKFCGLLRMYEL